MYGELNRDADHLVPLCMLFTAFYTMDGNQSSRPKVMMPEVMLPEIHGHVA